LSRPGGIPIFFCGGSGRAATTPPPSEAYGRRRVPQRFATRQVPATRAERVAARLFPPSPLARLGAFWYKRRARSDAPYHAWVADIVRRLPKVTVTRVWVSLCQKGVTRWLLFLVNCLLAPKRVKTSRGASFEPWLAPPSGRRFVRLPTLVLGGGAKICGFSAFNEGVLGA
jgi:hypothetical protein